MKVCETSRAIQFIARVNGFMESDEFVLQTTKPLWALQGREVVGILRGDGRTYEVTVSELYQIGDMLQFQRQCNDQ